MSKKIWAVFAAATALSVIPAAALADELNLDSREFRPAFREMVDGRVVGDPAEDCAYEEFQVKDMFSWVKNGNFSVKARCQQAGAAQETSESRARRERAEQEGRSVPSPEYRGQEVFNLKISLDVRDLEALSGQSLRLAKKYETETMCKYVKGEAEKVFVSSLSSDKFQAALRCVAVAPAGSFALEMNFKFKEAERRELASWISPLVHSGEKRVLLEAQASARAARPDGWGQRSPAVLSESVREASMGE